MRVASLIGGKQRRPTVKAAVLYEEFQPLVVEDVDLEGPRSRVRCWSSWPPAAYVIATSIT